MANKRRPKQTRPPYRRYVYQTSFVEEGRDNRRGEDPEHVPTDNFGNWQDFNPAQNTNIRSVYVLTQKAELQGKKWPLSQFEKVDVLACCLYYGSDAHMRDLQLEKAAQQHAQAAQKRPVLPPEIVAYILEILWFWGELKPRFLRLSRLLHAMAAPLLYRRPELRGDNFHRFVDTVNGHKTFGSYIRDLDLAYVNQSGKNASVAKLLKRLRPVLVHFVAPQTSFGLGPLMALRGCVRLKSLDLRLVSETLNLEELFLSIRQLDSLTHLSFPRLSIEISDYSGIKWPPRLEYLRVSGGISDEFLMQLAFPTTIRHMEFAHCPKVEHFGFQHLLLEFGRNLRSLRIQFPMPGLHANSLDSVFELCPNLHTLEVSVDYLLAEFFDERYLQKRLDPRPLRTLYIDSSGMLGTTDKLDAIDLALALSEARLPLLKNVRCTAKLGWDPKSDGVLHIASELEDRGGGLYIGY
ncbi:hypothetical protein METBIDRAFT_76932 [Metschnikowia bicuspidata var. bicuspidata NRRL YB-4993]|uniref:F-box domain-containing protein n=1 Tax=Metschnikowia bicuspidata var. bicuspidata NRRL YB-4993 TaxID=869754 RepID=A0A1A0HJ52_9ASCO|nr:hypothetical protein METBIDRAFT_76932 [Metschnikowia bicuspidata var. bicuspidata NRRL YB-4993]OBA24045.1 hypothetical protein METBIDRAFT_76932 [Metschnikowia bicuspidata var. bicuspidata NRRL YB-4993]